MNRLRIILQFRYFCLIVILVTLLISFIRCHINYSSKYYLEDTNVEGILLSKKIDGDRFSFIIKGKEKVKCTYYLTSKEEKDYFDNLDLGVKVSLVGTLSIPSSNTIPNTFNYKKYLKYNHINYIMTVNNLSVLNNKVSLKYKIKNLIINHIKTYKTKDYLMMFILGDKSFLDGDEYSMYQDLGVSHIFAISGLHISIISGILLKVLKKFNDNIKYGVVISFLLFYLSLICTASVVRSVIFFIFLFLNKKFDFNLSSCNVFYLSVSFILLVEPFYLYNLGFIYSSVVCFSLIRFSNVIKGRYFVKCIKISLISILFSLPITINNNFEINVLSFLNNLFFVPVISFIIYPFSLITFFVPFLDDVFYFLLSLMELVSNHLFVFNIVFPRLNVLFICFYYFFLYIFFNTYNKKILLFILVSLFFYKYNSFFDNSFYVYYLDVGQGDSCLIKYKNKSMLIDTGGSITYEKDDWAINTKFYKTDNTITFMKSLGVYKLDYLVLTHGDTDHMGEASHLVENFRINKVVFNCGDYQDLETELINNLKERNINYFSCIDSLKLYNFDFKFLYTGIYDNENDNSNVIYLNAYGYKFLFMGDASTDKEDDIIDIYNLKNIDFLKVGHHGSDTSSGSSFINLINPRYSIISVGKNNRYGHPKESVLNNLANSYIYRTDEDGSIEIKLNKDGYKIRTYVFY